jgi:hypothetical protein
MRGNGQSLNRVSASHRTDKRVKQMQLQVKGGNTRQETLLLLLGDSSYAYILLGEAVPDYNIPK